MKKEYPIKCIAGNEPRILVTKKFMEKNNLAISLEVAKQIAKGESVDIFGFSIDVAINCLSFADAKAYLDEEYIAKIEGEENQWYQITDSYELAQDFLDYMVFAWMKARDERGISAARSIVKLSAYMKILSRPDIADILSNERLYPMYGKPALREACEKLKIKCPEYIR